MPIMEIVIKRTKEDMLTLTRARYASLNNHLIAQILNFTKIRENLFHGTHVKVSII